MGRVSVHPVQRSRETERYTMFSGFQRQLCQAQMRVRGGRYNHHVQFLIRDHFIGRAPYLDIRMVSLCIVVGLWAALDDCVKSEFGYGENKRNMKDLGT